MKITAFETQKVCFDEISHYGCLFLKASISFKPNLHYLDHHNFSLVCSRTFWILAALKKYKKNNQTIIFCVTQIKVWYFFGYFFFFTMF